MTSDMQRPEKEEIAREILLYLSEHPGAQDTLEGILQWWLLERKVHFQIALVKEALSELMEQGLVHECRGKGSLQSYRLSNR